VVIRDGDARRVDDESGAAARGVQLHAEFGVHEAALGLDLDRGLDGVLEACLSCRAGRGGFFSGGGCLGRRSFSGLLLRLLRGNWFDGGLGLLPAAATRYQSGHEYQGKHEHKNSTRVHPNLQKV